MRLTTFAIVALLASAGTAHGWKLETKTSPIDDSTNVMLSLESAHTVRGRYRNPARLTIMAFCRENQTSLFVHFGGHFMASSEYHDWGYLTYRVDKEKAKTSNWQESTSHESLALSGADAITTLKDWADGESLFVKATPFSANPVSATFKIAGLREALTPLVKACGWELPPARWRVQVSTK